MNANDSVTEQIMQYIREQIINGNWEIGSKIPSENELCKTLGFSRTSLRSALQRYNVLGILQSEQGKGTFVRSNKIFLPGDYLKDTKSDALNKSNYLEWRRARNVFEPEIAYAVAKTATPELVEQLVRINQEQHDATGNQNLFIQKDAEFHLALAEAFGNRYILSIMREFLDNQEMMRFGNEKFGFYGGIYFHVLIADAISKHDAARAKSLMYEHGLETGAIREVLKDK
ncbi:MAG: GntR family transcriptional regulator [Lachnospiraceae bacterium]|nr:GntR family transcriptional regulator [Lachnospiraceae bacterium]